jgi:hypothetical protein
MHSVIPYRRYYVHRCWLIILENPAYDITCISVTRGICSCMLKCVLCVPVQRMEASCGGWKNTRISCLIWAFEACARGAGARLVGFMVGSHIAIIDMGICSSYRAHPQGNAHMPASLSLSLVKAVPMCRPYALAGASMIGIDVQ